MEITLTDQETRTLAKVLTSYLSDLRMEVAGTDSMDYREALKEEEALLKGMIARLAAGAPHA